MLTILGIPTNFQVITVLLNEIVEVPKITNIIEKYEVYFKF